MDDETPIEPVEPQARSVASDTVVEVRPTLREMDVRLVPFDRIIQTMNGPEVFRRGAFAGTDPSQVRLWGLEHEIHMGLGQNFQPKLTRHPTGKAIHIEERSDGAYATFKVARTARGDEVLELALDQIASGVSVEFDVIPGGTVVEKVDGKKTLVHRRVKLTGASTTYQPAYGMDPASGSVVLAVRTAEGEAPVPDQTAGEQPAPAIDQEALAASIGSAVGDRLDAAVAAVQARAEGDLVEALNIRIAALEEENRTRIVVPGTQARTAAYPPDFGPGHWMKTVLRSLAGETIPQAEMQARIVADLITTDNLGVIPTAYLDEIIGIIDQTRPFLGSTRRISVPSAGMQLSVPKIVTRPTTGVQAEEKDELTSTPTSIVPATFDPVTIGGYGDISLQLLRRSDPSYLELYIELLSEAYAIDADDQAVDALLAESTVVEGGAIDPDDGPLFGDAWANAAAVSRRLTPDTIWLSSAAVAAFINAQQSTTNAPLYGNLAGAFSAAGGEGGTISGLRPVHVPALNDEAVDVIVGPSRGFAWTEDGTFTLQVDVPARAGRDVALVGMLWFAPLYPAAFTTYTISS